MVNENGFEVNDFSASQKASAIIVNETYSYINNSLFYALAPAPYYNYFYNFVRRYANWYDRYVPTFHNPTNGIFSTGIAHSLVDGIANLIVGAQVKLQNVSKEYDKGNANNNLSKAYEWARKAHLTNVLRQAIKYACALGTSLLKHNIKNGEIWCEALRMDDFWFRTDFAGELEEVTCLIKSYTDTGTNALKSQRLKKERDGHYDSSCDLSYKYYLVEHRYFKTEFVKVNKVDENGNLYETLEKRKVPYAKYEVHQYNGSITNAQSWTASAQMSLPWDSIPQYIRKMIIKDYSIKDTETEMRLPFTKSLGCALLRYNNGDCSLPQQPFGQSVLTDIIGFLMGYDLQYSYFIRDLYQGKGIVFVAKELITNAENPNALNGLDESLFTGVPTLSDKDNKLPIDKVQFDLRVADWREARNLIYESIASHLNISPSSIAGFLSDNTARTAKEITTEASATDNYIEIQRGALTSYINDWLTDVCKFYGWTDMVGIRWAKSGTSNLDTLIDRIIKLKQAGLITQYEALKMYMVDADERDIEEADAKLTAYNEQQAKMQASMASAQFGMDMSNDFEDKL